MARTAALTLILLALGVARGYELQSMMERITRLLQGARNLPPVPFSCERDGLFPHPDDCATYVRCSGGAYSLLRCPSDLHFNPESSTCQEPCKARCDPLLADECGRDESAASLSSSDDACSRPRFKGPCDAYRVRHYYDPSDGQCKKFIFGGCRSNGNNFKTREECLKTCAETPDSTSFRCYEDGLFRNPGDCGTFIQCSNGRDYVMPCPEGLHFDEEERQCRSPCDARCDPQISDECGWDAKSSRKFPTIPRRHSLGQSTPGFYCVRNGQYRNPGDCGTFVQCSEGRSYVMPCPEGLHFDEEVGQCQSPCDAKCDPTLADECGWDEATTLDAWKGERSLWEPTEDSWKDSQESSKDSWHSPDEETTVVSWTDSTEYSTLSNKNSWSSPTEDSWSAAETDTEYPKRMLDFSCVRNGLYPNPDDCGTFIQCSNGHPYIMQCPKSLHFSKETQRCESPCDARCDLNMACDCNWPECGHVVIIPNCYSKPTPGPCDQMVHRYYYDYESGRCRGFLYGGCYGNGNNYRTLAECQKTCQRRLLNDFRCPSNTGNFGHYPDCLSYYACKRGVPYLKRCPKGTAFHHKKAKCVPEHEAVCLYMCPYSDAVYPMENDCRQYIDCVNGIPKVESCPPGQAFDPRQRDCVDEGNVSCARR